MRKDIIFRGVIPGSSSRLTIVDNKEICGRHILRKAIKDFLIKKCVDLGCDNGNDLDNLEELQ
jgi:hypothetical protein